MSNEEKSGMVDESKAVEQSPQGKSAGNNSGVMRRLAIMLGVFVIAVGGIWGYLQYLESKIPKPDMDFVKQRDDDAEPEPEPSPLEVLGEIFSGPPPTDEVTRLKEKSPDEVVFTYDAIMNMSREELDKNIQDVTERLRKVRSHLPPSVAGASMGAGASPRVDASEQDEDENQVSVSSLALPLEVMKQVAEDRK